MPTVTIHYADMHESMQQDAVTTAQLAVRQCKLEKEMAAYLKQHFDSRYNPIWHCIVGRNFGCYLTHENSAYIHFMINNMAIILYKSA